jgi:hypothetical protein
MPSETTARSEPQPVQPVRLLLVVLARRRAAVAAAPMAF